MPPDGPAERRSPGATVLRLMAGSVMLTIPVVVLLHATERPLTEGIACGAEES
jgi:ABC-type glycerol-3-phosphate transport system permease component